MMKKILLLLITAIMLFSLTMETAADNNVEAENESPQTETSPSPETPPENGGFIISDGVLTGYTGTQADITIPNEVTHIAAGAFSDNQNITSITVAIADCTVDNGAFPSGITIYGYAYSNVHRVAAFADCTFVDITPQFITITVNYLFPNGAKAAPSFKSNIKPGRSYSITSPAVDYYNPSLPVVQGTAGYEDLSIDIVYTRSSDTGWKVTGNTVRYYENGGAVKDTSKLINGKLYSFDSDGNVILSGDVIVINGNTYYLENGFIVKGYRTIGQYLYCFGDDGAMLKNTSRDGFTFNENGALVGNGVIVNIGSDSYYLIDNTLCNGYRLIGNNIAYFGTDYKMVKNATLNSCVFDENGYIISGISASSLKISPLPDMSYTGTPLTPEFAVIFNDLVLTSNIHYTASFSSNTEPGTATLTVNGMGPVSGGVSATFEIIKDTAYLLTIKYVTSDGDSIVSDYITKLKQGESYSITSPVIEGYKADKNIVKGIAGDGDITVTVTYSKIGGSSSANTSTDKADPMESETLNDTDDTTVPQSETDVTDDSYENDSYSDKYESDSPDPMDSRDDEDPDEIDKPNTIVESEAQVDVTVETIVSEVIETNVKYNYELLFKVITISTLICGCIIAAIIKWEKIVKVTLKFVKDIVKKD